MADTEQFCKCGKCAYASRRQAADVLKRWSSKHSGFRGIGNKEPYRCPTSNVWHVGANNKMIKKYRRIRRLRERGV